MACEGLIWETWQESRQHGIDTTKKSKKNGVSDELAKDLNMEMGNQKCPYPFFWFNVTKTVTEVIWENNWNEVLYTRIKANNRRMILSARKELSHFISVPIYIQVIKSFCYFSTWNISDISEEKPRNLRIDKVIWSGNLWNGSRFCNHTKVNKNLTSLMANTRCNGGYIWISRWRY